MAGCGNVKVKAGGVKALRVKAAVLAKSGVSLTGATLTLIAPDGLTLSSGKTKGDLANGSKTLVMPLDTSHTTARALIRADECLASGTYYIPSVLILGSGVSTPGPTAKVRPWGVRVRVQMRVYECAPSHLRQVSSWLLTSSHLSPQPPRFLSI